MTASLCVNPPAKLIYVRKSIVKFFDVNRDPVKSRATIIVQCATSLIGVTTGDDVPKDCMFTVNFWHSAHTQG